MLKSFDTARDIVNQLSTVNEVVVFNAGIFTGSPSLGEINIRKFNHWTSGSSGVSGSFYHAIYNQNFTSSLAVELVDVAFGYSHSSSFFLSAGIALANPNKFGTQVTEKNRVYKLFAKHLLGNEKSLFQVDGQNKNELIFLSIKRSQYKDELKKGTVALHVMNSGSARSGSTAVVGQNIAFNTRTYNDLGAVSAFDRTTRGDVGELMSGTLVAGLVYYQAGVLVLVPELISDTSSLGTNPGNTWSGSMDYQSMVVSGGEKVQLFTGTLDNMLDAIRYRMINLSVVNQANLHSTFYFARALNDEFNYSSNPTFVDASGRIITTSGTAADLSTRTYITKIGLLGENSEVLAVASLSEPLKKAPDNELVIKVRLDY